MYTSRDPQHVHRLQSHLHQLQKSNDALALARGLLDSPSLNCKYFGALTYTVAIHEGKVVDRPALYADLLRRVHTLAAEFVVRKLMANVAVLFLQQPGLPDPVVGLAAAMAQLPGLALPQSLPALAPAQLAKLLLLFAILAEEAARSATHDAHTRVRDHIYPQLLVAYEYMAVAKRQAGLSPDLEAQALATLEAWMLYVPNVGGDARYGDLAPLFDYVFLHFPENFDFDADLDACRRSFAVFNDVLELNPSLVPHDQKQHIYALLFGAWGKAFVALLQDPESRHNYHDEAAAYVELVLTVLLLNSLRLSKSILDESTQNILQMATDLSALSGVPFVDDFVSDRMLVFWAELASVYEDLSDVFDVLFEAHDDPQFQNAFEHERTRLFNHIATIYWRKIHFPPAHVYGEIRTEFALFRVSVLDFFLGVYSLLKAPFYRMMASALIDASQDLGIPEKASDVEATMFLIYKINDDSVYFESQAASLVPHAAEIFALGLLGKFLGSAANERLLSTLVLFLSSNEFFFKSREGSVYLEQVFHVLLPLALSGNSSLSLLASKVTAKLCEECSTHLGGLLPDLEAVVVRMLRDAAVDSLIRLRMFNAYSAIAKSTTNVETHSRTIAEMLRAIQECAQASSGGSEAYEEYVVSLLSCIVNIARGSTLLDDEIDSLSTEEQNGYQQFWARDPQGVKLSVLDTINKFSIEHPALSQKTIVVEKCCMILRAGMGEKLGGPFDVGTQMILQYVASLMAVTKNANSVPYIYGLAECCVSANFREMSPSMIEFLVELVFTSRIDFLGSDPDMVKAAVDLFTKILECKPSLLIFLPVFGASILPFASDALGATELYIIKSVLKFWGCFFNLKKGSADDQAEVQRLFLICGNYVTSKLMDSFISAPRSSLDHYFSIFRGVVAKFPLQFKAWLVDALTNLQGSKPKLEAKNLEMFVHKLMVTRGRRTANDVLKLFWLEVNGQIEYSTQRI